MGWESLLFKILNPIMKAWLKSPFHSAISDRIMIISFTGRSSGKMYSTPVSYYREGGHVVCFTHAMWWKNIGDGSTVEVRVRGQEIEGHAVAITDDDHRKEEGLFKLLKAVPSDAGFYNVRLDENKEPIMEDIKPAASDAVMIQIEIRAESRD